MAATGPLVGCNTCRCFVDPKQILKYFDGPKGKWVYKITHHGETFYVQRDKQPFADSQPIGVGAWSPCFSCPTCGRDGIRPDKLKADSPKKGRTSFEVSHCGKTYLEEFDAAELERKRLDRQPMTNVVVPAAAPIGQPMPPDPKNWQPMTGDAMTAPKLPPPILKPAPRRVRFARDERD